MSKFTLGLLCGVLCGVVLVVVVGGEPVRSLVRWVHWPSYLLGTATATILVGAPLLRWLSALKIR